MKLSIVVSVYNGEFFVAQCLNSLVPYMTEDMELIVVNDGSTDKTLEELERFNVESTFKLINLRENIGLLGTRIEGALEAKGDYIYFMDVDDSLSPDFFSDIPKAIDENNPDLILFGAQRVFFKRTKQIKMNHKIPSGFYKGEEIKNTIVPNLFCTPDLYGNRNIMTNMWVKVFRREVLIPVLKELRGRRIIIGEDLAVSASAIKNINSVLILPYKPYYNYMTNSKSIMNTYKKNMFEETLWLCDYLETICSEKDYLKGVARERAFFAISSYYNEFFYKSDRTKEEKRKVVEGICRSEKLVNAIDIIDLKDVKFPNSMLLKMFKKKKIRTLMVLGSLISTFRPIIAKFVQA